jgi:hypothetical protein
MNTKKYPAISCCGIDCGLCGENLRDALKRFAGTEGQELSLKNREAGHAPLKI